MRLTRTSPTFQTLQIQLIPGKKINLLSRNPSARYDSKNFNHIDFHKYIQRELENKSLKKEKGEKRSCTKILKIPMDRMKKIILYTRQKEGRKLKEV